MSWASMNLGWRAHWRCRDCSACTYALNEYYMVTDHVWFEQARMPYRGMLCIGCLERRIGRRLRPRDFSDYPINSTFGQRRSMRLKVRLGLAWP
jgi:hypothetical protein